MSTQKKALSIDIPVKLTEVKIVFSIPSLSFEGDLPAAIFHMGLVVDDVADWKAKSQAIAVFHTNAGHVTLRECVQHRSQYFDRQPIQKTCQRSYG